MKRVFAMGMLLLCCVGCTGKTSAPVPSQSAGFEAVATPTPLPTPSVTQEPMAESRPVRRNDVLPPKALSALALPTDEWVEDWQTGDMNGDGVPDYAVVSRSLEKTDGDMERSGDSRTLSILLGDGEKILLSQRNDKILGRSKEGGMMGDPYEGISLANDALHINEYGGSSSRWGNDYCFIWKDAALTLDNVTQMNMSTHTGNGTLTRYDFERGIYTKRMYSEHDEDMEQKLLYQISINEPFWHLEDVSERWSESVKFGLGEAPELPPLPSMQYFSYATNNFFDRLHYTAGEILDITKEKYYPDMVRVDILWQGGTWENYSAAVGYEVPRYYYSDGAAALSYFVLENFDSDFKHTVMYEGKEMDFFWLWDSTGKEVYSSDS